MITGKKKTTSGCLLWKDQSGLYDSNILIFTVGTKLKQAKANKIFEILDENIFGVSKASNYAKMKRR